MTCASARLPYAAGVYLFPACLIDARSDQFKVSLDAGPLPASTSRAARSASPSPAARTFMFACADAAQAATIVSEVQTARDRAMHAKATEDPKELVAVDPLAQPTFLEPGRSARSVRAAPAAVEEARPGRRARRRGDLRARRSGRCATTAATRRCTRARRGERHRRLPRAISSAARSSRTRSRGTLLPRAELRDAERVGTVDALLKYKTDHPATKIVDRGRALDPHGDAR